MYCSIADILSDFERRELLLLINDESRDEHEIDLEDDNDLCAERITEQITKSGDEIDSYLRSRYALPLSETPPLIKQICKDLTSYNLYKRRRREDMPESVTNIRKEAIRSLEKIQKGILTLDVEGQNETSTDIKVNKTESDRIFTDNLLDRY